MRIVGRNFQHERRAILVCQRPRASNHGFVLSFPGRLFLASCGSIDTDPVYSAFAGPMHNARRHVRKRHLLGLE
jgi:hypothetical protein